MGARQRARHLADLLEWRVGIFEIRDELALHFIGGTTAGEPAPNGVALLGQDPIASPKAPPKARSQMSGIDSNGRGADGRPSRQTRSPVTRMVFRRPPTDNETGISVTGARRGPGASDQQDIGARLADVHLGPTRRLEVAGSP